MDAIYTLQKSIKCVLGHILNFIASEGLPESEI